MTVLVWRVEFDGEVAAQAVIDLLGSGTWRVARHGSRITIARAYRPMNLDWAFGPSSGDSGGQLR